LATHGPRTFSAPNAFTIPGQLLVVLVNNTHFDTEYAASLQTLEVGHLLIAEIFHAFLKAEYGAERAGLCHAPTLHHGAVMLFSESLNNYARTGSATHADALKARNGFAVGV
jgi:hypothetical protein